MSIPLSLYVHLPWCAKKCPYCDFNSHPARGQIPEVEYVEALIRDLDFELRQPELRPLQSIFFGGGTPSLFSGGAIARILDACASRLQFAADMEITLEANPGTADAGNFRGYRAAGVNRLSIGVQSLDDAQLRSLGRIHGRDEALHAVDLARSAGFSNLNLDLMFALPEQTLEAAMKDLREALALGSEHLSWYHLTLEPNTEFAARPPPVPDADVAADMHDAGCALLAEAGFTHYETSAFSQAGREARHNLNYWSFGDYLGIGAGAHAKRSLVGADGRLAITRRARQRHPRSYMENAGNSAAIQEQREVVVEDRVVEFCMNVLRLPAGFSREAFETRTGLPIAVLEATLQRARALGLIVETEERIQPSVLGQRHLNRLLEVVAA